MKKISKLKSKIQSCRYEITRFDDMVNHNENLVDCVEQMKMVIMSHLDILDETLIEENQDVD